jgi:transcriptional regulator with GAF, ATPase, and Fis domain
MTASGAAEEFAAIAAQLRGQRTIEQTYQAIVGAAPRVVEGCDRAAIGILEGEHFRTAASTDDIMRAIDKLQDALSEGPCLEASADESVRLDNDIAHESAWPRLAERVLATTPVRAMLALPLVIDGRRNGALNLFADQANAFGPSSVESGAVLAAFATVAVSAALEAKRADQLQAGLETNREIGAAVGILMATHKLSSDEAFAVLSKASQRLNRKLRDIAAGIVRGEHP